MPFQGGSGFFKERKPELAKAAEFVSRNLLHVRLGLGRKEDEVDEQEVERRPSISGKPEEHNLRSGAEGGG
jgi:hypothetical protein